LQEGANCTYTNATQIVYRMNPGDCQDVEVIAVQFGERAAGQSIALALNGNNLQPAPISAAPPFSPNPPQPPTPTAMIPVATPTSALTIPSAVTTDNDGSAKFQMMASDPGNPRGFIDGQVYNVVFSWAEDQDDSFPPDSNGALSVLSAEAHRWRGEFPDAAECAHDGLRRLPPGSTLWFAAVEEAGEAEVGDPHAVRSAPRPVSVEFFSFRQAGPEAKLHDLGRVDRPGTPVAQRACR